MDNTTNIRERWEETLIDSSKKLVQITYNHYTGLLATLNEKIEELENVLDNMQLTEAPQAHTNTRTQD